MKILSLLICITVYTIIIHQLIIIDKNDRASQEPSEEVIHAVERVNDMLNVKLRKSYEEVIVDLHRENVALKNYQNKVSRL